MADNTTYTAGSGTIIAADDVGGVLYQRVKPTFGIDGEATDVSSTNPLPAIIATGELLEAIEAMRMAINSLTKTIGGSYPDTAGRLRVALDSITAALTLATVTTVGTVTTVSTLSNQTSIGGLSAAPQVPSLMLLTGDNLRRNINVT